MIPTAFNFYITKADHGIRTEIRMGAGLPGGGLVYALPITIKEVTREERENNPVSTEPMLSLDCNGSSGIDGAATLQNLMDALWKEGIRPRDIGTPGHLAATQAHLDDMRKITFGLLKESA